MASGSGQKPDRSIGFLSPLAGRLHGSDIGVTIVCPGTINTPIIGTAQMRGGADQNKARAAEYYAKHGASPDRVAADVLTGVFKGRLFCVTPRREVGPGWLLQRLSPRITQTILGSESP